MHCWNCNNVDCVFISVVIVTADEWLMSFLQVVPCKTVIVITTEDNTAQVSQAVLRALRQRIWN